MKMLAKIALTALIGSGLVGCQSRADLDEIKANQAKILKKLDEAAKAAPARPAARQRPAGPDKSKTYALPVIPDSSFKGKKDAWVTIVEVSDFQCPFCSRVLPTLKQVEKEYGDDVKIVFYHNPLSFHKRAMPAAVAAECSGEQGKFWPMHDKLFENQRQLEDADIKKYAASVGLNTGKFDKCYADSKYKARVTKQQQTAAKFGARGTPAFFINGRFLSGAQPFPAFKALIDEELKKAKASGLSKGDYYAKKVVGEGAKSL